MKLNKTKIFFAISTLLAIAGIFTDVKVHAFLLVIAWIFIFLGFKRRLNNED